MAKKRKAKRKKVIEKKVKPKGIGGNSFIAAGIVVMLVPAALYVIFGDFVSFLQQCTLPFSTVNIDGMIINCTEIRFVYVLSYFCLFFGLILIVWGLAKKIMEAKK